eukprot:scaffold5185_cov198-Alexandrium_tamarense.AAC.11
MIDLIQFKQTLYFVLVSLCNTQTLSSSCFCYFFCILMREEGVSDALTVVETSPSDRKAIAIYYWDVLVPN